MRIGEFLTTAALLAAGLPLRASIPRPPLSVSRQADSGFATVSFGLDLPTLTESVTNEAGALVRLAGVLHDSTPVAGFAWRADGLPASASNECAAVSWTYDGLGRKVSEAAVSRLLTPNFSVLTYAYNSAVLATNTALGVGSWALDAGRSFDPAGRLSSQTSPAGIFRIAYDGTNGLPVSVTNAALSECRAHDLLGRVTNEVFLSASGAVVGSFAYRYDVLGLVTQKVSYLAATSVTNVYGYDKLGRLTNEIARSGSGSSTNRFTYDLAGNRLSAGGQSFSYSNNRLAGAAHGAAGNITNMVRGGVTLALTWNTQGQLLSVATNGVFAESYAYDPLGRRVSTTTGGMAVYHVYDGGQCADFDANGNPLRSYTWGPGIDNLLAITVYSLGATNTYYAVKDHLGSVYALVDASGAVAESYAYDARGNVSPTINYSVLPVNFSCRFLFHGGEYSEATGLYRFRARWYAPELGRWLSPDPIGLEGGLNLYEFCGNNPVNRTDPDGLAPQLIYVDSTGGAGYSSDRDWGDYDPMWGGRGVSPILSVLEWGQLARRLGETRGWPYAHVLANAGITRDHGSGTAYLASVLKEVIDTVKGILGNDDSLYSAFQPIDDEMNELGRSIPDDVHPFTWAEPYVGMRDGPPGPFYHPSRPNGSGDCN